MSRHSKLYIKENERKCWKECRDIKKNCSKKIKGKDWKYDTTVKPLVATKVGKSSMKGREACHDIEMYVVIIMSGIQLDFVTTLPKYVTIQFEERAKEHCRDIPFYVATIMEKRP